MGAPTPYLEGPTMIKGKKIMRTLPSFQNISSSEHLRHYHLRTNKPLNHG